jgi:hypothetical protein
MAAAIHYRSAAVQRLRVGGVCSFVARTPMPGGNRRDIPYEAKPKPIGEGDA